MKPAQEVTRGLHADLICLSSLVQHHHRTLSTTCMATMKRPPLLFAKGQRQILWVSHFRDR